MSDNNETDVTFFVQCMPSEQRLSNVPKYGEIPQI